MRSKSSAVPIVGCLALLVLAAAPVTGAERIIYNGVDVWHTSSDGSTYTDFAEDPIPADFFCFGSPPFRGKIHFQGTPIATEPPGALGSADTVVQRLDDAVFDRWGRALTRIQVRALSLTSVEPIDAGCGHFDVTATLDGEQPVTEMKILRRGADDGTFVAHLELRVKLSFRPAKGGEGEPLELRQEVSFNRKTVMPWSYKAGEHSVRYEGFVKVDTDGDGSPETFLPGTSNFVADHPAVSTPDKAGGGVSPCCVGGCVWRVCHCDLGGTDPTVSCLDCEHLHCFDHFAICPPNACSTRSSGQE